MTTPSRYPAGYVYSELVHSDGEPVRSIVRRTAELGRDTTTSNAQIAIAVLIDLGWTPPAVIRTHRPILAPVGTPEDVLEHIRHLLAPYEPAPEIKDPT